MAMSLEGRESSQVLLPSADHLRRRKRNLRIKKVSSSSKSFQYDRLFLLLLPKNSARSYAALEDGAMITHLELLLDHTQDSASRNVMGSCPFFFFFFAMGDGLSLLVAGHEYIKGAIKDAVGYTNLFDRAMVLSASAALPSCR